MRHAVFPKKPHLISDRPRHPRTARLVSLGLVAALLTGACGSSEKTTFEDIVAKANDASVPAYARCSAMGDLARKGERAVDPLRRLTRDPNTRVAHCAREKLAGIKDPEAVDELVGLLTAKDHGLVVAATEALGSIGSPAAVRPLMGLLQSSDGAVVVASVEALAVIRDTRALPAIEKLALQPGTTVTSEKAAAAVRRAAVVALGRIGDKSCQDTLVALLESGDGAGQAGTALTRIFHKDVRPLLPLLDDSRHIALAYALVDAGQEGTEDALATALLTYGDLSLAEYYLNCGNGRLEHAARVWADRNGYTVTTTPGLGGGGQWGSAD